MNIIYIKTHTHTHTKQNKKLHINGTFLFCLFVSFSHGKSLCKKAESSKLGKKELPPPAVPVVGSLRCCLDCTLAPDCSLAHSKSGSSTVLSAFVEGFFIVTIMLLGSGYTLMKCYKSEIKK